MISSAIYKRYSTTIIYYLQKLMEKTNFVYADLQESCIVHKATLADFIKDLENKYYSFIYNSAHIPQVVAELEEWIEKNWWMDKKDFESEWEKTNYTNHFFQLQQGKSQLEAFENNKIRMEKGILHYRKYLDNYKRA